MAKKAANDALFQSHLAGKTVCFAGRFNRWMHEPFVKFLETDGVKVVDDVSKSLDYLVTGATGFVTLKKKAEQLNQKGAAIDIIDDAQFCNLIVPTLDEFLQLLHAGEKGVARVNLFTNNWNFRNHLPSFDGQDLRNADLRRWHAVHGAVLEGVDLRGANLGHSQLGFKKCLLDGASFESANIFAILENSATSADFSKVNAMSQMILHCDFTRSIFRGVRLAHAVFTGCKFDDADLRDADLSRSILANVSLCRADLSAATLMETKLDSADLRGCKFNNANLTMADLSGANVDGADFTDANLAGANLNNVDVSTAIGLSQDSTKSAANIGPAVKEWIQSGTSAQKLVTRVKLLKDQHEIVVEVGAYNGHFRAFDTSHNYWNSGSRTPAAIEQMLTTIVNRWSGAAPEPESVTVSATKASQPTKELKSLALRMWCELFGVAAPSEDELKEQKKAAQASKKTQAAEWIKTLRNDPNGVDKWNADAVGIAKQLKAGLQGIDLSKANLAGWQCEHMDCKDSNFSEADLQKSKMNGAKLAGANLSKANLNECLLVSASLKNAQCNQASFAQADLRFADLCGADFTNATLTDAKFDGAKFDENTKFPKGFKPTLEMKWQGPGPSPAHAAQAAKQKARKPLDTDAFMKRLEGGVDAAKLDKALSMLKADRFKLYAQVTDSHLVGVVKSQGDPTLVYSCKLASDGVYGCCTQNLNICGGLRGSLCKHLLVLIVGLTRAGDLDPNTIDNWVLSSKGQKPVLDKDAMSETFLRYKGAEAGEVDWRPTETIPEDYYAM